MAALKIDSMRITHRLWIILAFTALGVIFLTAAFLVAERASLMNDHRTRVKHLSEVAVGIANYYQKQEASGALTREQAQTQARNMLRSLRYGDNDYIYVYDFAGNGVVVPGKEEMEGKNFLGKTTPLGEKIWDLVVETGKKGGGFMEYSFPRFGTTEPKPKVSYTSGMPAWGWAIGTGVYVDDVERIFYSRMTTAALMSGIGLILAFGLGYVVARSILRQLGGEPAYAASVMRQVASGDLTVEVKSSNPDSLLGSLADMLNSLRNMIGGIAASSRAVEKESSQVAETAQQVARNAERQSDSTSTMAAAMEQMTVSINHISDSARDTEENSSAAAARASSGETQTETAVSEIRRIAETVGNATDKIRLLVSRANEIGSAATVIKEIAGQTNLLALNAAIEAARAGEQGRGFAVVADEVRALAERTSTATVQIEQMIKSIQDDTALAVSAMESARNPVDRGVAISEQVASSLREIRDHAHLTQERSQEVASATREQSGVSNSQQPKWNVSPVWWKKPVPPCATPPWPPCACAPAPRNWKAPWGASGIDASLIPRKTPGNPAFFIQEPDRRMHQYRPARRMAVTPHTCDMKTSRNPLQAHAIGKNRTSTGLIDIYQYSKLHESNQRSNPVCRDYLHRLSRR